MKIVTNIAEYIDYFRQLAEGMPGINSFVWGSSDIILSKDRSDLDLPCLWLEVPEIVWLFKDDLKESYDTVFTILENVGDDEWSRREAAFNHTGWLTKNVIKKINADRREHIIQVDLSRAKSYPVDTMNANGDKGWRTQGIVFNGHDSDCLPDEMNQSDCPIGTLPKFYFNNSNDGDFNNLLIEQKTLPTSIPWVYEWKWFIDNGPVTTSDTATPLLSGSGRCMYLQLKISDKNCTRYASAEILNTVNSGFSVPFKIKKIIE